MNIDYKGYVIQIELDSDPMNPREEFYNLGTMVCGHKHRTLGDVQGEAAQEEAISEAIKAPVKRKIYAYEHGGITIRCAPYGDPFDSGLLGYIYVTANKISAEFPSWKILTKKRLDKIGTMLEQEVEQYDQYLTGDVYGYRVLGKEESEEIIDSGWGYYGSDHEASGLLESARHNIDFMIKKEGGAK